MLMTIQPGRESKCSFRCTGSGVAQEGSRPAVQLADP